MKTKQQQKDEAWEAYQAIIDPALKAYNAIRNPARKAYEARINEIEAQEVCPTCKK